MKTLMSKVSFCSEIYEKSRECHVLKFFFLIDMAEGWRTRHAGLQHSCRAGRHRWRLHALSHCHGWTVSEGLVVENDDTVSDAISMVVWFHWLMSQFGQLIIFMHTSRKFIEDLHNLSWGVCKGKQLSVYTGNISQNTNFSGEENTFENVVCKMAAILCRHQWIKFLVSNVAIGKLANKTRTCHKWLGY